MFTSLIIINYVVTDGFIIYITHIKWLFSTKLFSSEEKKYSIFASIDSEGSNKYKNNSNWDEVLSAFEVKIPDIYSEHPLEYFSEPMMKINPFINCFLCIFIVLGPFTSQVRIPLVKCNANLADICDSIKLLFPPLLPYSFPYLFIFNIEF